MGTGSGLGALTSQAFGAKNYRRVGLLLQRQLAYQFLLCVPIALCWWYTEAILLALGQPPRVAYFSGVFLAAGGGLVCMCPCILEYFIRESLCKTNRGA